MKKQFLILVTLSFIMTTACMQKKQHTKLNYPVAKKVDTVDTYFAHHVADPYRWLEDDNSAETAEWVAEENAITNEYLSKIPFREQLRKRLTDIWNYPKYGVPFKKGDHYFFFKNDGIQNQSVLYIQDTPESEASVLLDPNSLSEDGTVALASMGISKDGKFLAYSIARGGSDWNEIYVLNIENRQVLPDHINWVKFSGVSWKDNGFFYSGYDQPEEGEELKGQNRFHKVYYHHLNTDQKNDQLIYENKNEPLRTFSAYTTEDEAFLLISESESTSGNSLFASKLNTLKDLSFVKIANGFDYEYQVIDHIGDQLILITNFEAPKQKLVLTDYRNSDPAKWEVLIPEKEQVLQGASLVSEVLFTQYLEDASSKAYFYTLKGELIRELELPTLGSLGGFNGEKGNPTAFYGFSSFPIPSSVYKYDITSGKSTLIHASEVDFDASQYQTEQVFFASKDGTRIPMFIVHKKNLNMVNNNPTLMYGYGGFNISLTPGFSVSRATFLEQGGIFVMVNLRGGGEYGEAWHKQGILMNKQNVFDDFIAAAKYLINNKYTSSEKLAIMGGSNGGLLIGACMTQEPELFEVAIPIVGVMDMLRYQDFTIGWAWASDYGRSDESEEMFNYLYGYSPLHNIKDGVNYPATLAITADHDDRVVPAHTFKYMATLQEKDGGKNPVLVRIETKAGHGAGKPTSKQIDEAADMYSFIMFNLGMHPEYK
ncbi:MAG: prolyl oligopeptidase family serine peptidase [Bacteroidales bacterium]